MSVVEDQLKSLLLRGLEGDSSAYRDFLVRMRLLLRQFVRRQVRSMHQSDRDVDDIVQEALIAINKRRHTYDGETPVTAWAYAIARYKLIDNLRATHRLGNMQPLDEFEEAAAQGDQADARITVRKVLTLLPDKLRIPIELMKLEGLNASEVARRTGATETAVRVRVHRGLEKLARLCGVKRNRRDEK